MFFSTLAAMPLCHPAYSRARFAVVRCGCLCLMQTIRGSLNPLLFQLFIGVTLCRFLVRVKRDFMVSSGSHCAGPFNPFSLGSKSILKGFLSFSPAVCRGSGQFLRYIPSLVSYRITSWGVRVPFICRPRAANAARVLQSLPSGSSSFPTTEGVWISASPSAFCFGGVLFCLILL